MFEILTKANEWILAHQALVATLAVPFLTLLVTYISSRASEMRAEKSRVADRKLQTELRLSEFRQNWISGLRDDFADFYSRTGTRNKEEINDTIDCYAVQARILMRMNVNDPEHENLTETLQHCLTADEFEELGKAHAGLTMTAQRILKREWERLKADLQAVEK